MTTRTLINNNVQISINSLTALWSQSRDPINTTVKVENILLDHVVLF